MTNLIIIRYCLSQSWFKILVVLPTLSSSVIIFTCCLKCFFFSCLNTDVWHEYLTDFIFFLYWQIYADKIQKKKDNKTVKVLQKDSIWLVHYIPSFLRMHAWQLLCEEHAKSEVLLITLTLLWYSFVLFEVWQNKLLLCHTGCM